MLRLIFAFGALILPIGAVAQDVAPVITPGQVAEGQYYRSRMGTQAKAKSGATRARPPVTRARQQQICASRPSFREKMGASDPQVLKLDSLCAKAGF
ncbi:MAG: hypothetical protein KJ585_12155 [Alphaproteobacteria bacterium]|jgi:hypothetical protein|uniref:hypothetical protein n=1 Tax=Sphingobium TaxID=165695 RepID=UPI003138329F|nr:hypothetical protein [Alphaproteobacteria bacterium]